MRLLALLGVRVCLPACLQGKQRRLWWHCKNTKCAVPMLIRPLYMMARVPM